MPPAKMEVWSILLIVGIIINAKPWRGFNNMNVRDLLNSCQTQVDNMRQTVAVDRWTRKISDYLQSYMDVCQSFIDMLKNSDKDQAVKTSKLFGEFLMKEDNSPVITAALKNLLASVDPKSPDGKRVISFVTTVTKSLAALNQLVSNIPESEFPNVNLNGQDNLKRLCNLAIAKIEGEKNFEYYKGVTGKIGKEGKEGEKEWLEFDQVNIKAVNNKRRSHDQLDNIIEKLKEIKVTDNPKAMKDGLAKVNTDLKMVNVDAYKALTGKDLPIMLAGMVRQADELYNEQQKAAVKNVTASSSTANMAKGMQTSPKQFQQANLPTKQEATQSTRQAIQAEVKPVTLEHKITEVYDSIENMLSKDSKSIEQGNKPIANRAEGDALSQLYATLNMMRDAAKKEDYPKIIAYKDQALQIFNDYEAKVGIIMNEKNTAGAMLNKVKEFLLLDVEVPEQRQGRSGAMRSSK